MEKGEEILAMVASAFIMLESVVWNLVSVLRELFVAGSFVSYAVWLDVFSLCAHFFTVYLYYLSLIACLMALVMLTVFVALYGVNVLMFRCCQFGGLSHCFLPTLGGLSHGRFRLSWGECP